MTLRDDLIPVVDDARSVVDGLGLRVHDVAVVRVIKMQNDTQLLPVKTETLLTLRPRPRVRSTPRLRGDIAGQIEVGDVTVDRISAAYTRAQLDPVGEGTWRIDGQAYRLVSLQQDAFGWVATVTRVRRNG